MQASESIIYVPWERKKIIPVCKQPRVVLYLKQTL